MAKPPGDNHWLVRRSTIIGLWWVFGIILVATVAADLGVEHHPHFGVEGTIGFGAWYGFFACVVLVLFSRLLGVFLKRKDDYYDR